MTDLYVVAEEEQRPPSLHAHTHTHTHTHTLAHRERRGGEGGGGREEERDRKTERERDLAAVDRLRLHERFSVRHEQREGVVVAPGGR